MAGRKTQDAGRMVVDMLLEQGKRELALGEAARWGVKPLVKQFLDEGIDVNWKWKDQDGSTALMKAAYAGEHEIVRLLIEHGADVNATSNNGRTALHDAVSALARIIHGIQFEWWLMG